MLKFNFSNLDFFVDFLGDNSYNELIRNIADYFKSLFSKDDIYKYDNNTLLIFLSSNHEERNNEIVQIQKRFNSPFKCGQTELTVSYTFSVYNIPKDVSTLEELIRRFDSEMIQALSPATEDEKQPA